MFDDPVTPLHKISLVSVSILDIFSKTVRYLLYNVMIISSLLVGIERTLASSESPAGSIILLIEALVVVFCEPALPVKAMMGVVTSAKNIATK